MHTVKVAATAEEDLNGIWAYVAQYNEEAAKKLIKEITGKFAVLSDYPQMGREQHKLIVNLRSFAVKGYVIFYQPIVKRGGNSAGAARLTRHRKDI